MLILLCFILIFLVMIFSFNKKLSKSLKKSASLVSKSLAWSGVIVFLILLLLNIFYLEKSSFYYLGMPQILLLFFLFTSPMIFSSFSEWTILSFLIISVYTFSNEEMNSHFAEIAFISCLTIIYILSDKIKLRHISQNMRKISIKREYFLKLIQFSSLLFCTLTIFRIKSFHSWLYLDSISKPSPIASFLLVSVVLLIWLSIILNLFPKLLTPILAIPTILFVTFLFTIPTYLLIIPFTIAVVAPIANPEIIPIRSVILSKRKK